MDEHTGAFTAASARTGRYQELDALRGVAALAVVLFHIYGNRSPDQHSLASFDFDGVANLALTTLFGGTGAVTLFFVLSGFVLAQSLAGANALTGRLYASFAVKRLFRLIPVAWCSIGLAIVLMRDYYHMEVPWSAVVPALYLDRDAIPVFNGPLWSINVEMLASLVFPILLFASRWGRFPGRVVLLLVLVWLTGYAGQVYLLTYLFCFQLGIMARELIVPVVARVPPSVSASAFIVACGLVLASTNLSKIGWIGSETHVRLEAIGAVYLIGYVLSPAGTRVVRVLETPPLLFLGAISYSLYAFHYPLVSMLDWVSWSYVSSDRYLPAQTLCVMFALPTCIFVAWLGNVLIERPSQRVGRALARRIQRSSKENTLIAPPQ
jgi:peptidoglycan/LPS O-acetylase OafA/YrhL